jgi:hypothetical protein
MQIYIQVAFAHTETHIDYLAHGVRNSMQKKKAIVLKEMNTHSNLAQISDEIFKWKSPQSFSILQSLSSYL